MTQMIEVNVAEATGAALDWMVGQALGAEVKAYSFCDSLGSYVHQNCTVFPSGGFFENGAAYSTYKPSAEWSHGGPLIERCAITLTSYSTEIAGAPHYWLAQTWEEGPMPQDGPTPLIAACRTIVTAKLGDKVMVPVELINNPEDAQPGAGN